MVQLLRDFWEYLNYAMSRSWVWWFGLMDQNSVFRPLCLPIVHSVHSCIITLNVHSRAVRTWLLGLVRWTNEKTWFEYATNQIPAWWLSELCWIDVGRMSCKFLAIFIWKVSSQSGERERGGELSELWLDMRICTQCPQREQAMGWA